MLSANFICLNEYAIITIYILCFMFKFYVKWLYLPTIFYCNFSKTPWIGMTTSLLTRIQHMTKHKGKMLINLSIYFIMSIQAMLHYR